LSQPRERREQLRGFASTWGQSVSLASFGQKAFPSPFPRPQAAAIRNKLGAGVAERVAASVAGHKARSIFRRYNIVSEGDLREAAKKIGSAQLPVTPYLSAPAATAIPKT
jgi:hypothetical protein